MPAQKQIKNALVSVYYKDGLDDILSLLAKEGVRFFSTGGTQNFIESLGFNCTSVESLTSYPPILGGRVKTLHPKIFGGILARRDISSDLAQLDEYQIPEMDLVIVDLYPFEETLVSGASESEIIEKIDIGGISLIRAAAKNFNDVLVVASQNQYVALADLLKEQGARSTKEERKWFAREAFATTSSYDTSIFTYFDGGENSVFRSAINDTKNLRYGENPHQKGQFFGKFDEAFEQLQGKEISYNNLLDIDAACQLIEEFSETTFAILKHNNACGIASRDSVLESWQLALAADPISAFGGVLITNGVVDKAAAEEINTIFFEIIIAPDYHTDALEVLMQKKNRIILIQKPFEQSSVQFRSVLNGVLLQDKDFSVQGVSDLNNITKKQATEAELEDLVFANKLVKSTKSNAIILVKNKQLLASGVGQTSRVDALNQAIDKAGNFGFKLEGAVMASDAFFPFPDCVEIACKAGIVAVVQPGGSIKDQLSIDYCDQHGLAMAMTGVRHFKH
ncbi:IMP cyclohydrolase and phosphoribosylaminoimidazolecarboxamide formyltransferase [Bacteroidales bacterium]|nr:IMP cyclohydrolase and phosphoribosylaminoimidazolecarboxamide formyltransferase [Bacteroidales bacterium]